MQKKFQKGFTLIEFIVVIAIIAILGAIVLVSVNSYIEKSKDSAVKANMNSLGTSTVKYYYSNGTLDDFTSDTSSDYSKIEGGVAKTGSALYFESSPSAAGWASCAQLVYNDAYFWCMDSAGKKIQIAGTCNQSVLASHDCDEVAIAALSPPAAAAALPSSSSSMVPAANPNSSSAASAPALPSENYRCCCDGFSDEMICTTLSVGLQCDGGEYSNYGLCNKNCDIGAACIFN